MVSYPDTGPVDRHALAIRPASRAPSVASTSRAPLISSHRRQSRQIRSHAGGASYQPQNEFPIFTHTGDVEIIITSNPHARRGSANAASPYGGATAPRRQERFLLHHLILAQCSGFFEEYTSSDFNDSQQDRTILSGSALARLPPSSSQLDETGRRKRWRFELDWGENGDEMPVLVQKVRQDDSFTIRRLTHMLGSIAHVFLWLPCPSTTACAQQASRSQLRLLPEHGKLLFSERHRPTRPHL